MRNALWKTCFGSFATAVFCAASLPVVFGAEAKSIEDMERELNALKASVSSLTEQISSVRQGQEVANASFSGSDKEELEALRNEVSVLRDEMQIAADGDTMKAEDITGNVYSEFAKKVKLGAQIRTRAEYANGFYNPPDHTGQFFGSPDNTLDGVDNGGSSRDDDYVLNRTRLWADADVNEHLRMFIQIQDSRAFGASGSTIGNGGFGDDPDGGNNRLDLHQGYADIRNLFELPLTVRLGRQEIVWGDHRVIGNFIWSNIGRTFDGGRIMYDTDAYHAELFAVKTDENGFDNQFDGDGNHDENVYAGMLSLFKVLPKGTIDLMYIQKNDQDEDSNSAVADGYDALGDSDHVIIHDFGIRADGKLLDNDAVDYTWESHFQTGDYGDQTHTAWALAARAGYTFKDMAWTPRFGLEYDYASGDDDIDDKKHETFDNLYPTNHWQGNYGFIDLVGWRNMHDFRGNITVKPTDKLTVRADFHYFLLAEEEDGWYLASGALATGGRGGLEAEFPSSDEELAWEFDLTVKYDLYKNIDLLAGYSFFKGEDWIDDTFGDEIETNWAYIQTTVNF
ncbi:MAG: alginate export family protein [Candidatus Brocadiaceae bacterium]|nr:alginate export family protein [Candidatus Brocadiaceae bacterium]